MHAVSSQSASKGRTIPTSLYCAHVVLRPLGHVTAQLKRVCLFTHSVLFLKCNLLQNKLKVEQIVHSCMGTLHSLHF